MRMCRDMTIFVVFEKLNFQAVIKSAASAASRETKNQGPRSRGAPEPRRPQAEPSSVGSPGSWSLIFGLPGGCASSRLDHGVKFYVKIKKNEPKMFKKGFCPKVKSSKMGLSITPRQCL